MSTTTAPSGDRRLLGIGLALAAYFMFTGIDSSAKWLALGGIPALQIVFLRYALHLVLVLGINLPRHGTGLVGTASVRMLALRAALVLGGTSGNFIAVVYLRLSLGLDEGLHAVAQARECGAVRRRRG